MPKIGMILSGCGVFDGSEIHEAVLSMLCLDRAGALYQCMAPNKEFASVNHLTKQPDSGPTRNVLAESARIARGDVLDLAEISGADYDGFILPGGYGAAKNLCTFATDGSDCQVDDQVRRILTEAHHSGRPIGLICIAPAVAARVFGQSLHPMLTIGRDAATAKQIELMGARHTACTVDEYLVDEANRIITTPAYMDGKSITQVHAGIEKMVARLVEMVEQRTSAAV